MSICCVDSFLSKDSSWGKEERTRVKGGINHLLRAPQLRSHMRKMVLLVRGDQLFSLLQAGRRHEHHPGRIGISESSHTHSHRAHFPLTAGRRGQPHAARGPSRLSDHIETEGGPGCRGGRRTSAETNEGGSRRQDGQRHFRERRRIGGVIGATAKIIEAGPHTCLSRAVSR